MVTLALSLCVWLGVGIGGVLTQPTTCVVTDMRCARPPNGTPSANSPANCGNACKLDSSAHVYYTFRNATGACACYSTCPLVAVSGYFAGLVSSCASSSGTGDPRFTDAHGVRFDFSGAMNQSYCLLADQTLHLNALLQGHRQAGRSKPMSWMKGLGLTYKDQDGAKHEVVMLARRGKEPGRGALGFISQLSFDGALWPVPNTVDAVVAPGGGFSLTMVDNVGALRNGLERDTFVLSVESLLVMHITVNAESEIMQTPDDAQVHFNFKITLLKTTNRIHGLLGQSYRMGLGRKLRAMQFAMLSRLLNAPLIVDGETGAGYLDGKPEDYEVSSLTAENCKVGL